MESGQGCMALKLGMKRFCYANFHLGCRWLKLPNLCRSVTSLHLKKNVLHWDLRSEISLTSKMRGKRICSCGSGSLVKPFLCRGPGTYHFLWSVARTRSCCNFTGLLPTTQLSKNEGLCRRGTFCKTRFWFLFEAGQILPFIRFHWGHTQNTPGIQTDPCRRIHLDMEPQDERPYVQLSLGNSWSQCCSEWAADDFILHWIREFRMDWIQVVGGVHASDW